MGLSGALCLTQNGPKRAFWMRDALHTHGPTLVQDEIWGRVERNFRFLKGLTQFPDQTEPLGVYALCTHGADQNRLRGPKSGPVQNTIFCDPPCKASRWIVRGPATGRLITQCTLEYLH